MSSFLVSKRQTILDLEGRVIFFGIEEFYEKIVHGSNCFICGTPPDSKEFNKEHVIPNWIIRKLGLDSRSVTLPNKTLLRYGKYKVPCCTECNKQLDKVYEKPISRLFKKEYQEIVGTLKDDPAMLSKIRHWLSLIYFKLHYKDRELEMSRDRRTPSAKIATLYHWGDLHHVHCISRSHYTRALIEDEVYGTLVIFPAKDIMESDGFDLITNSSANLIMLKFGGVVVFYILNDSRIVGSIMKDWFARITGSLNEFQTRQLIANMVYLNLNLQERPKFTSGIDLSCRYVINAIMPEIIKLRAEEECSPTVGELMRFYLEQLYENEDGWTDFLERVAQGKVEYLFDENGQFIT